MRRREERDVPWLAVAMMVCALGLGVLAGRACSAMGSYTPNEPVLDVERRP